MEFSGEENLWSFVDEERKRINLPRRLSFGNHHETDSHNDFASPRTSCASATSFPLWPRSPESPWTRSPMQAPPTPPLLFHCLASLHRSEGQIFSIAASKDYVFTGSDSRRIHAWKLPDCIEMGFIKASVGGIRAILAHGKLLFTTHADFKIRVWEVPTTEIFKPKKITSLPRRSFLPYSSRTDSHKDLISCIAYNYSEKLLYTGSWDRTVKVWKISTKQCIHSFVAHEGHINAIVINHEDGCVFTGSSDGTVKIWRRVFHESSHILTMKLKFQESPINALALSLSLSGCFLYSGSSDGLINYWEKEKMSGRFNHRGFLQGHHFSVLCLVSIADLILSGSEDATIRIWRREEGNSLHSCLAVIDGHRGPVRCLAASLETENALIGLLVYSASLDQTFKIWRVKVYPAEEVKLEKSEPKHQVELMDCQTSPVLSPSWVERKMQDSYFD